MRASRAGRIEILSEFIVFLAAGHLSMTSAGPRRMTSSERPLPQTGKEGGQRAIKSGAGQAAFWLPPWFCHGFGPHSASVCLAQLVPAVCILPP